MKKKMYSLAIRKRLNENDFFWNHSDYEFVECKIDCGSRYWLADPFLFEWGNKVFLFYEAFDLYENKGKIGYSIYNEDEKTFSPPQIIISEKYHMSFPFIFSKGEEIYIMPESCGDYSVHLYRAQSFPKKWERDSIILPDVYACDSVLLEKDNKSFIIASEMYHNVPCEQYSSCWVKNRLYKLDGFSVKDEGIKVAEGDFGIRNAGKIFIDNGKCFRIGQDCRGKQYGRGLVLFEIESLEPYSEKEIWHTDFKEIGSHIVRDNRCDILGAHTYNFCSKYEIIDYSRMAPYSKLTAIRRTITMIKNGAKYLSRVKI